MSGGKFANGAVTSAFSYGLNQRAHQTRENSPDINSAELSEINAHADSILSQPAGSDGVKELSIGELHVVMAYEKAHYSIRSTMRGGYENMNLFEFAWEAIKYADSKFYGAERTGGYGGTKFRIIGGGSNVPYQSRGGDINYIIQGYQASAAGVPFAVVVNNIMGWNFRRNNLDVIKTRVAWARYGYDYHQGQP